MPDRYPAEAPKTGKNVRKGRRLVRCLGPKTPEHKFYSTGPGNRVCGECIQIIFRMRMDLTVHTVHKVSQ